MSESLKKIIRGAIILSLVLLVGSFFAPNVSAWTAWSKNSKGQFVNDKGKVIEGATMKGVDVSKWQGNINWKKVAKTDVDFAIIRCGYRKNGKNFTDEYWEKNVQGCVENNIPYGTYIYSYAKSTTDAKKEANHVLKLVDGKQLSFPIYYDMEENSVASLGKTKIGKIAYKFMNTIKAQGYQTGVYANLNWWTNYIPNSVATDNYVFKWVARYNSYLGYKGAINMWQCTSVGKVKGISGNVDLNFWFGPYKAEWFNRNVGAALIKPPAKGKITSIKAGKKKLTVKWKKVKNAVGYKIKYATKKNWSNKKTLLVTKNSVKLKKLKAKKRYYIKVKAYVLNENNRRLYGKWSKRKSKKTK